MRDSFFCPEPASVVVVDAQIDWRRLGLTEKTRVDLLFLHLGPGKDEGQLLFCEAKHYENSGFKIVGGAGLLPESQAAQYGTIIEHNQTSILSYYDRYLREALRWAGLQRTLPVLSLHPRRICLLAYGFDSDQQNGRLKGFESRIRQNQPELAYYAKGGTTGLRPAMVWSGIRPT